MIFDMDGTLLDSMPIWSMVEIDYLKSIGVAPHPDLKLVLRALSGLETAQYFQTEYGVRKTTQQIEAERNAMLEDYYVNRAPLKEGVLPTLKRLKALGVRMCVVTATDRYLASPALRRCGILDFFERVFTCGEEGISKSDPDIFIHAAEFLGTDIGDTLVVEDALYAMRSAKKAGFPVAAVYDLSYEDRTDEIKALADFYFVTMDEMHGLLVPYGLGELTINTNL